MNILIIGGAGFLGAHTVRRCLREPENRVTVLDFGPSLQQQRILNPCGIASASFRQHGRRPLIGDAVQGQD